MTGPSFCWQCRKKLSKHPQTGELIFVEVEDPVGNRHRVHKTCFCDAKAEFKVTMVPPEPKGEKNE